MFLNSNSRSYKVKRQKDESRDPFFLVLLVSCILYESSLHSRSLASNVIMARLLSTKTSLNVAFTPIV